MNKLIVLSGVPGSGKSYFSAALKRAIKKHVYIVSSDELRLNILGNQQDLSEDELVWKIYYSLVEAYSIDKNGIVILDATHSKKVYRLDNIMPFRHLYNQLDLVCFRLDKDLVLEQNKGRENPIPKESLLRLIDQFEMPDEEEREFYDHVDIIKDHETDKIIARYLQCIMVLRHRDVAQLGSALPWGGRGRQFKSDRSDQ